MTLEERYRKSRLCRGFAELRCGNCASASRLRQIAVRNQIITHYGMYDNRPADQRLLISAVETHHRKLGRVPRLLAADAGYYPRANEEAVKALGVDYASIPNRGRRSEEWPGEQNCLKLEYPGSCDF